MGVLRIVDAFEQIFKERKPTLLQTDHGLTTYK